MKYPMVIRYKIVLRKSSMLGCEIELYILAELFYVCSSINTDNRYHLNTQNLASIIKN